jgi:hypothetical protein
MKNSIVLVSIMQLFIATTFGADWSSAARTVKYVQYGRKVDVSPAYDYVQIGATDGTIWTYKSTCVTGTCTSDGVKNLMVTALMAKEYGDEIHFNIIVNANPSFEVDAVYVGQMP